MLLYLKMDDTSKNDSLKLACQITGNCSDDPKEEFHSDDDQGTHQFQLEIGTKFVWPFAERYQLSCRRG